MPAMTRARFKRILGTGISNTRSGTPNWLRTGFWIFGADGAREMAVTVYPDALRGIEYLRLAEEFYQAYTDLPSRNPPYWPRYFMLCHSIELGLKAYLAYRGATHEQLKKQGVRYNLRGLMRNAVRAGLSVKTETRSLIELLDEAHSGFWPRYPRGHGNPTDARKPVFVIDQFSPAVRELLNSVADAITIKSPPTTDAIGDAIYR
jgi:hypothetical protein